MPRGRGKGGYGPKKNYKGQRRHFTDSDELREQMEREEKKKAWRRQQGIDSDEESGEEEAEEGAKGKPSRGAPGELPPSDSEEESDSEDDQQKKAKGVEHLIEIENPNRAAGRTSKKVTELQDQRTQLSRREREELEKQQAKLKYQQLHSEGKTEEARADLARLAIIKKQREEAAKKREEERKAQEAAKEKKKS